MSTHAHDKKVMAALKLFFGTQPLDSPGHLAETNARVPLQRDVELVFSKERESHMRNAKPDMSLIHNPDLSKPGSRIIFHYLMSLQLKGDALHAKR